MWTEITRSDYERRGGRYASDMTDREWALLAPFMPTRKKNGRPRTTEMRDVMDAMLPELPIPSEDPALAAFNMGAAFSAAIRNGETGCIELVSPLFLKAFLMFKGTPANQLKRTGHRVDKLARECASFGLAFGDEDTEVIELIAADDTFVRSRYIETGSFTWPTIEALDRTCEFLYSSVRAELKAAGRPVR